MWHKDAAEEKCCSTIDQTAFCKLLAEVIIFTLDIALKFTLT